MYNNNNNNNNSNVPNVRILAEDRDNNAVFLSNGYVIKYSEYFAPNGNDIRKNIVQIGSLRDSNTPNVANILNMNGTHIGNMTALSNGRYSVEFFHNGNNNQQSNNGYTGGGYNNGGIDVPGGGASGSVVIGNGNQNNNSSNTQPQNTGYTEPKQTQKENKVVAPLLSGYEFLPIPTTYTDLRFIPIGDFRKYEIIIKKDENMETNKHKEMYETLKNEGKQESSLFGIYEDMMFDISNESSIAYAINLAYASKNVHNILYGYKFSWAIANTRKIEGKVDISNMTTYSENSESYYVNNLVDIINRSSGDLGKLLRGIDKYIENKPSGVLFKEAVADIINEEYNMVNDAIRITPKKVTKLGDTYDTIIKAISSAFDDVNIINEFDTARDNIYRRLTNPQSLEAFSEVENTGLTSMLQKKIIEGLGFKESFLCVTTRNASIITELSVLLDSNETNTFLIDVNTPNTLRLVNDLMTGNVRFESSVNFKYDITSFASNPYQMILYILGAKFKIYRKQSKYYITRLS